MTEAIAPMSPFIQGTNVQFAWDSTSMGLYKECPRKYYYTMIGQWHLPQISMHLTFGLEFHKALEDYDKLRALGEDYEPALKKIVQDLMIRTDGWETFDSKKNRQTLVRSVIWYLEHYRDDTIKTIILANGKPAVELSFKMDLGIEAGDGNTYLWCGHMDRLVDYAGTPYVMDRKTSGSTINARYFDGFSPDNQMSGYTLAGKIIYNTPVAGVIIDAAQIAVGFTSFQRGFTMRTEAQLNEWVDDLTTWLERARVSAEEDKWPMNDKACHNYGGCVFRGICSLDPRVRDRFLESNFTKREWNPLEER